MIKNHTPLMVPSRDDSLRSTGFGGRFPDRFVQPANFDFMIPHIESMNKDQVVCMELKSDNILLLVENGNKISVKLGDGNDDNLNSAIFEDNVDKLLNLAVVDSTPYLVLWKSSSRMPNFAWLGEHAVWNMKGDLQDVYGESIGSYKRLLDLSGPNKTASAAIMYKFNDYEAPELPDPALPIPVECTRINSLHDLSKYPQQIFAMCKEDQTTWKYLVAPRASFMAWSAGQYGFRLWDVRGQPVDGINITSFLKHTFRTCTPEEIEKYSKNQT